MRRFVMRRCTSWGHSCATGARNKSGDTYPTSPVGVCDYRHSVSLNPILDLRLTAFRLTPFTRGTVTASTAKRCSFLELSIQTFFCFSHELLHTISCRTRQKVCLSF